MKRYAGQNEVRFKITDKQKEIYDETAWYLVVAGPTVVPPVAGPSPLTPGQILGPIAGGLVEWAIDAYIRSD
jgi:hypothetical protein